MKTVRDLIEERGQKVKRSEELINLCKTEGRDFTDVEGTEFDGLDNEIKALDVKIERQRKVEEQQARSAAFAAGGNGLTGQTHKSESDERDLSKFSLAKLIRAKSNGENISGIEAEVNAEGFAEAARNGVSPSGNIVLPYNLFAVDQRGVDVIAQRLKMRRDLSVTGTTSVAGDQGGMTVQTEIGRLFEALFNKLVLRDMGATFLPGLRGNMDIPRLVKGTNPAWKAENAAADETSPTFSKAQLSPKRLPTYIEVSNQLFLQSEYNINQVLASYLTDALSSQFDQVGIAGTGASNQPTGILNTAGIGAVYAGGAASNATNANGAAPVWADFPNLYKEIAIDNADFGSLGYLVNPNMVAKLQTTEKATGTAVFIMPEGAKTINGFKAGITNNVPANLTKGTSSGICSAAIFGNFRDLWMGTWGGIELMVNPYSLDTTGQTRINATIYADVAVPRPESFAAGKDFLAG